MTHGPADEEDDANKDADDRSGPQLQTLVVFQNDRFNGRFRDLPQLKRLVVHSGVFNRPLDELIELEDLELIADRFNEVIGPKLKLQKLN